MNFIRSILLLPILLFLCFTCGLYFITFLILTPLKYYYPDFYFKIDLIAAKVLGAVITGTFKIGNVKVYEFGEDINKFENENCLLSINHQSTLDVPLVEHLLNSKGIAFYTSWVLDEMFKWAPFGWIAILRNDIFIKQGKDTRVEQLKMFRKKLNHIYTELCRKWLIVFPEGGFYYKRIASSKSYALKNGYPILDYVTLPRLGVLETTFKSLSIENVDIYNSKDYCLQKTPIDKDVKQNRNIIKYIIDVTIAYHNINDPPSFISMILGKASSQPVYVYYRIYDIQKISISSTEEIRKWLFQVYKEKNDRLALYYSTGTFQHLESDLKEIPSDRLIKVYRNVHVGWDTVLFYIFIILLWTFSWIYIFQMLPK